MAGRLHPLTPARKAWVKLSALAFLGWENWHHVRSVEKTYLGKWIAGGIIAGITLLVVVILVLAWRRTSYELTRTSLEYRSGLFWREHQCFDVMAIQSVDIVRPFFGQLFGVCALRITIPSQTERIDFLSLSTGRRLRDSVLAVQAGKKPGRVITTVDPRVLALSMLLELHTMGKLLLGLVAALSPWLILHEPIVLGGLLAWAQRVWHAFGKRYPNQYGWVVREIEGGHQIEYGLVNRDQFTWKSGQISRLTLHQPILWRKRGWVQIWASSAAKGSRVLIPVTDWDTAMALADMLLGDGAADALSEKNRHPVGPAARWCTPWWRAVAWSRSDRHIAAWRGLFLRNVVSIAPMRRVITSYAVQNWWQRLHGRASVGVDLAGGATVRARHRTLDEAVRILADMREMTHRTNAEATPMRRPHVHV